MNNIYIMENKKLIHVENNDELLSKNIYIYFSGNESKVIIDKDLIVNNKLTIYCGEKSFVYIERCEIGTFTVSMEATNSKLSVGENTSIIEATIENHDESNLFVDIGKDCMFSYGILIRPSDGHTIYNIENPNYSINYPKNGITIGEHVWIGAYSRILKDTTIPSRCIIGINSVVTNKIYKENSIIAGIPAKTIKNNVDWDRRNYNLYKENEGKEKNCI